MSLEERIAWISAHRLGDTLFQTPAVRFLKQQFPNVSIDVITLNATSGAVYTDNPYVEKVLVNPTDKVLAGLRGYYQRVICGICTAKNARYVSQLGAMTIALGGMYLPGYQRIKRPSDPLEISGSGDSFSRHAAFLTVAAIRRAFLMGPVCDDFKYDLFPSDKDRQQVLAFLKRTGLDPEQSRLVGLHIGCRHIAKSSLPFWFRKQPLKSLSPAKAIEICKAIHEAYPEVKILLTGSKGEAGLVRKVVQQTRHTYSLVDQLSLAELAALMAYLSVYIAPDTGAIHVAYATEAPVVGLFGPTDPLVSGPPPSQKNHIILKKSNRIDAIAPVDVLNAIQALGVSLG